MTTTHSDLFEPKPRWLGAPKICLKENLPAFETWKKADAFHEANSPGSRYVRQWQCSFCDCWHYLAKPRPPSGDSSGSSRR